MKLFIAFYSKPVNEWTIFWIWLRNLHFSQTNLEAKQKEGEKMIKYLHCVTTFKQIDGKSEHVQFKANQRLKDCQQHTQGQENDVNFFDAGANRQKKILYMSNAKSKNNNKKLTKYNKLLVREYQVLQCEKVETNYKFIKKI